MIFVFMHSPITYCTMGTGSFPGVKRPGRGADHPPPTSICRGHERVGLYLYSPYGPSWSVIGRTFTFTYLLLLSAFVKQRVEINIFSENLFVQFFYLSLRAVINSFRKVWNRDEYYDLHDCDCNNHFESGIFVRKH
jgi:hypothetical protein